MESTAEDQIESHLQALLAAFAVVLDAEDVIRTVKAAEAEAVARFGKQRADANQRLEQAWAEIERLMAETGEVEVLLPGAATDYKIARTSPRETVKVEPHAVPEQFCQIERKPRLKEICEFLKGLREQGLDFPNWASFQPGTSKLGWKAVKKTIETT